MTKVNELASMIEHIKDKVDSKSATKQKDSVDQR